MTAGRILVVDDEQGVRSTLSDVLRDEGFEVEAAQSGEECLAIVEERPFEAILLDVWLPGCDGLETLRSLRRRGVDAAVIMISGHGSIETAVRATRLGAHDFVEKPLSIEKITLTLRNALRARKLEERNRLLREELRRDTLMIGRSEPLERLRERIETAAPTDAGVLITGENGVGKALVGRLIHARSPRAEEPFIEVPCAAVPPDQLPAELFGAAGGKDGAGAKGRLELARDGTVFLDAVWALPAALQQPLLRALETGRFLPIGGHVAVVSNIRPIAATERDLAAEVAGGRFREDLRSKLNVVPMVIPPLRERREDVPLLVEHFMDRYAREYGRSPKSVEPSAMATLTAYDWPGNVRELRNLVERLVILVPRDTVTAGDLPSRISAGSSAPDPTSTSVTLHAARAAFEKRLILLRLEAMEWNISKTAETLGIERSNLYRKMKAHGIRAKAEQP